MHSSNTDYNDSIYTTSTNNACHYFRGNCLVSTPVATESNIINIIILTRNCQFGNLLVSITKAQIETISSTITTGEKLKTGAVINEQLHIPVITMTITSTINPSC